MKGGSGVTTSATRPAPGPPRDYTFPPFQRHVLANGMRLVVAPVTTLPVTTVMAVVDAGAAQDPAGSEGLAQLTARLLLEGTAQASGADMTERFEQLGASLDAGADWDAAVAHLTVMSDRLPEALVLLGEVLMSPAFPVREVERLKSERLAELLQLRAEPRGLADEMFSRFVYAPESRYALPEGGGDDAVRSIGLHAVAGFYRARYQPAAVTLVIAGDVRVPDVEALAARVFGSWTGGTPPAIETIDRPSRTTRAVHLVVKEDAPQSELRVGHVGLPRAHPDFFDVVVMNALLGGLFSSRINLNLREEHAYTYGAFSGYDWRRAAGPFSVSTAVKSDVTADAAREILREVERMRADPVTEEELSLATSYLDGVFPIKYETTAAIARALANLVIYALPDDYFDCYRARIRGVTASGVWRAAQRHLRPEAVQVVVVGDPAAVREPLAALALGPLAIYASDGTTIDG